MQLITLIFFINDLENGSPEGLKSIKKQFENTDQLQHLKEDFDKCLFYKNSLESFSKNKVKIENEQNESFSILAIIFDELESTEKELSVQIENQNKLILNFKNIRNIIDVLLNKDSFCLSLNKH